jgi:OFA family oxalate/formate antiporter-like MFS transporter
VPAASWLQSYTGGWHAVFVVAAIANLAVAATAFFIVKPMRAAHYSEVAAAQLKGKPAPAL